MINGTQWDRVLEWLVETEEKSSAEVYSDSSTWGNYSNYNSSVTSDKQVTDAGTKVFESGSSEYWKANNIYDLAGNAWDWTQEANYANIRVTRGGYFSYSGSSDPVSFRDYNNPYRSYSYFSARPALYVGL